MRNLPTKLSSCLATLSKKNPDGRLCTCTQKSIKTKKTKFRSSPSLNWCKAMRWFLKVMKETKQKLFFSLI
ncbi:hypothetical protein ES288_D10G199800v1 [Gossypium darwinii]|uniref:Uncharacterized protein n=1 Tax=Gossypium darwinii TaxID=34276 RepID=A0A5D2B318_GOSDA|nr:hypothetical protein ES288_D10G199800v1 [Gossypium darwinii]